MKKCLYISVIILGFISCEREDSLPSEYGYLVGHWVLDSCILTHNPTSITEYKDTISLDSLGYNLQFVFNKTGFTEYIENTVVVETKDIESVDINIVDDSSGIASIGYYIIYRTNEPFVTNALSIGYVCSTDVLKYSYVSDYVSYSTRHLFVFKRQ
ncbi:MAG: hypothetical protein A2W93_05345 [Bacteroidetes bacterium GWF2_43_63]|nr:MAG: hypothetical protein A2W94_11805 [Bacteroidetes bacterium GWE2_42_42]OFY56299.1 MAG: hypothetical protein A2W93_05345 [Bacteroidetes bacterium GWF2_43_63]HBG71979.1 hypothetical protein [Bacteroidales bacterium]HCB61880.1 hypothetical protein [Bacteroidales bacterium]HCY23902.1 hypothetical protein [Bacteroidales bacterium]